MPTRSTRRWPSRFRHDARGATAAAGRCRRGGRARERVRRGLRRRRGLDGCRRRGRVEDGVGRLAGGAKREARGAGDAPPAGRRPPAGGRLPAAREPGLPGRVAAPAHADRSRRRAAAARAAAGHRARDLPARRRRRRVDVCVEEAFEGRWTNQAEWREGKAAGRSGWGSSKRSPCAPDGGAGGSARRCCARPCDGYGPSGERRIGLGVDGDNVAAIRLYERAGMRVAWAAVQYEREVEEARADTGGRSSARVRH